MYKVFKWLFFRGFPLVTDIHVPEKHTDKWSVRSESLENLNICIVTESCIFFQLTKKTVLSQS